MCYKQMISQGMLVCLLFTLSIGVCLFMYIHQKTSHIESTINKVTTCIHSIQKQLFSNDVDKEEKVVSGGSAVVFEKVEVNDDSSEYDYNEDDSDDYIDEDEEKEKEEEILESSDISEVSVESDGLDVEEVVEELEGIKSVHVVDPRTRSGPNFKSLQLSELKQYIKDNEIPLKSLNKYKKAELVSILEDFTLSKEQTASPNVLEILKTSESKNEELNGDADDDNDDAKAVAEEKEEDEKQSQTEQIESE